MRSVLLTHLQCIEIVELDGSISSGREDEISCIMELYLPDRTGVHIVEGVSDGTVDEVPDLHTLVST